MHPWHENHGLRDRRYVASGVSHEEIRASYPSLVDADIHAALGYAAELLREGTVELPMEVGV